MAGHWYALPLEIRLMVLEETYRTCRNVSIFATVSKEWQDFFEKRIFHRLVLNQTCINNFKHIVQHHRRLYVKHICFQVVLPRFEENPESYDMWNIGDEINRIFTDALRRFLEALSSWTRNGRSGIALELSLYSPSNHISAGHDCSPRTLSYPHPHNEACTYEEYEALMRRAQHHHNLYCGPNELGSSIYSNAAIPSRLQINLELRCLCNLKADRLPEVHVVDELLVRNQNSQTFGGSTLFNILDKLIGVESAILEPGFSSANKYPWNFNYHQHSLYGCPRLRNYRWFVGRSNKGIMGLKKLSFFRKSAIGFDYERGRCMPTEITKSLEQLSMAFLTDAKEFFREFWLISQPVPSYSPPCFRTDARNFAREGCLDSQSSLLGWQLCSIRTSRQQSSPQTETEYHDDLACLNKDDFEKIENKYLPHEIQSARWPNLKFLALTSQLLNPSGKGERINDLLESAAYAATEMPCLQIMEIWNGGKNFAGIFRYRRIGKKGFPTITISSTWSHNLEPRVNTAWDKVPGTHGVLVELQALKGINFRSYRSVLDLLDLRQLVLNQVSQCQLMWEDKH